MNKWRSGFSCDHAAACCFLIWQTEKFVAEHIVRELQCALNFVECATWG
jgi:hypothetical protein